MTHYLINTDSLKKLKEHNFNGETPPILVDAKKQKWVELKEKTAPEYDSETHYLEMSEKIRLDKITCNYKLIPLTTDQINQNILRKRQQEYGEIGEQLGMIYDDKINGTDLWQKHIAMVKSDNPKIEDK